MLVIPNEFQIEMTIPPQKSELLSDEQVNTLTVPTQTFMIGNVFLNIFFQESM